MRRLRTRFPHCVHLDWAGGAAGTERGSYQERMRGRGELEVAAEFVGHVRGVPPTAAERELLARALGAHDRVEARR
jgi:exonuclease SbcD